MGVCMCVGGGDIVSASRIIPSMLRTSFWEGDGWVGVPRGPL